MPGEDRLLGRGVSTCATCDGPLLAGETAVVIGGGDSVLQESLELADHAGRVIVVHRGAELGAQHVYRYRAVAHPSIEFRHGAVVEEILGEERVAGVLVRDQASGEVDSVEAGGVFVYIGLTPQTSVLDGVVEQGDDSGLPTDASMCTPLRGLLAAGSVRAHAEVQAAAAAGDGAIAALAAARFLHSHEWPAVTASTNPL